MILFPLLVVFECRDNSIVNKPENKNSKLHYNNKAGIFSPMADPFVLKHQNRYYLYGTDDVSPDVDRGFKVYVSENLLEWGNPAGTNPGGLALAAEDSWGNRWFWGAEVYERDGLFYMFYTVDEHLAIATATSPLGPFSQQVRMPLSEIREIDCHLLVDDDGKAFMYYVSFENKSNEIFVEEMNDDWLSTKSDTKTRCIWWTDPWENSDPQFENWPVTEGTAVLKHKGIYYLFYTANHFLSPNYAVGYATSDSPFGPWEKYDGNPILKKTDRITGTGHCSFVYAPNDDLYMVYHAHKNLRTAVPRKMCIDRCEFIPDPDSLKPDIFKVYQTDSRQAVLW